MSFSDVSRRELLAGTAVAALSATISRTSHAQPAPLAAGQRPVGPVDLRWLDSTPGVAHDLTFTVPWKRGTCTPSELLRVETADGRPLPSQHRPLGFWPDGSVKWTAHSIITTAGDAPVRVVPGQPAASTSPISVTDAPDALTIDTGVLKARVFKSGSTLLELDRAGRPTLRNGRLVALVQSAPDLEGPGRVERESLTSVVERVEIEESGPVRTVVKIQGTHVAGSGRKLLPFFLRLYFGGGSDVVRMMHSFIYDCDESKDFLAGLGVSFDVPMRGELYDRHVRLVGEGPGLWGEAVKGITGLRRDPGKAVRDAQIAGLACPPIETWERRVSNNLRYIPNWGDFTLTQLSADGFAIRKRTSPGHGWIHAAAGTRAAGVGFVGSPQGGVAFGIRDFWQKHPGQIDIRGAAGSGGTPAHTDTAAVTLWLYSPEAPAMDLRFFHDGMGQDTYPKQRAGLDITYEDYEPGYGTPFGIARTSELYLRAADATPSSADTVKFADLVRTPPVLVCSPQRYLDAGVFGGIWTLPDRTTALKANLEDHLTQQLDQYLLEVKQRRWYGFWDYGDVMHSYDTDRNEWRYDVGGFAWANSELSPDLWLWYSFLRTGRADVYRMAEAMTRHTGEVDTYHIGRFRYLGTRHGVQHFSDSSKQTRISNASYRRHFFFLTADERTGDLLRAQLKEQETARKIVVGRKLGENPQVLPLPPVENPPGGGPERTGTIETFTLLAAWMTEAERTNDPAWHARILKCMQTLPSIKYGLFNGAWTLDLDTGECRPDGEPTVGVSHLSAVFGLPEIGAELHMTYGDKAPAFADVIAHYGKLYNAPREQQQAELGTTLRGLNLIDHHARLIAFAAWLSRQRGTRDEALEQRAWRDFFGPQGTRITELRPPTPITGPEVLSPISELPLSTNGVSQWGLTAQQMLFYQGDTLPQ